MARPPASEAETLDPAGALSAYEYLGALYNRLVRVDANGDLAPDLAESWEPDARARTWTFPIREGVTFHDGRRLTAADAGHTLRHIFDKVTASPQAAVLAPLTDPKTFRTPDEHTLVVTERVRELRPAYLPVDPVSRMTYQPGEPAQCDRWSPHRERRSLNSRSTRCP
ncbi:ABC transporter substrate-binding protein [Streptomyces mirabilis]|uniref:ABC transporter substrate-binding protein n=1 Tax=Streptomyces mirabilis TaxID=68239 RepID=UPI003D9F23EB